MLDKNRFVEIVDKDGDIFLPGNLVVRKVIPSEEELLDLEKDIDCYSLKVRNTYMSKNGEHHNKYYEDLSTLSDHLRPLYILKDGRFFGLCLALTFEGKESLGVFLVNGTQYGSNRKGTEKDIDILDLGSK